MFAPAVTVEAVPETITAGVATERVWEVVVVGAGPAGAATAWRLAAAGRRTLLVDRHGFPRSKVCGCCLSPRAVAECAALGPGGLLDDAVPLDSVWLCQQGRTARVEVAGGRIMSRASLDPHLVRGGIAAGSEWLPGLAVSAVIEPGNDAAGPATVVASLAEGGSCKTIPLRAERVVLATGLSDLVRIGGAGKPRRARGRIISTGSRIGVGSTLEAGTCDLPAGQLVMAVGRRGYCGLVRLEDGRIDIAAAIDRGGLPSPCGIGGLMASLLAEATPQISLLPAAAAVAAAGFRATPPLSRTAPLVSGGQRVFRVGDAASYVEPFTGEGIGWALAGARMLVASMLGPQGLRPLAEAAARYFEADRRGFGGARSRCRVVAAAVRRPPVVSAAIAVARAAPWAARMAVPMVVGR